MHHLAFRCQPFRHLSKPRLQPPPVSRPLTLNFHLLGLMRLGDPPAHYTPLSIYTKNGSSSSSPRSSCGQVPWAASRPVFIFLMSCQVSLYH